MLKGLIKSGFGIEEGYNCAEKMLYGGNKIYDLGLNDESLKVASGFGSGMAIESVCGALTGGIMVLGMLFGRNYPEENTKTKDLTKELLDTYEKEMGNIHCKPLKDAYRTGESKCMEVIVKAAEILDNIILRELELKK